MDKNGDRKCNADKYAGNNEYLYRNADADSIADRHMDKDADRNCNADKYAGNNEYIHGNTYTHCITNGHVDKNAYGNKHVDVNAKYNVNVDADNIAYAFCLTNNNADMDGNAAISD